MKIVDIDLAKTTFGFLQRFLAEFQQSKECIIVNFLQNPESAPSANIDTIDPLGTSSADYWNSFLKGFSQFLQSDGEVAAHNEYFIYLSKLYEATHFDRGLDAEFKNSEIIRKRLSLRYKTLDMMRIQASYAPPPITVYVNAHSGGKYLARLNPNATYLGYTKIDGYHRIFSAVVTGRSSIPATIEMIE